MSVHPEGAPVIVRIPPDPVLPPERQDWQAAWPRQDYLELAAVAEAVPSARYHVHLVLREWGFGDLAYDVDQVTAELVANAVAATQAAEWTLTLPPVRLWLLATCDQAMIVIWDATTHTPIPRRPGPDAESGRGLLLVAAFADWGYYFPPPSHGGKVVHALLPKASTPQGAAPTPSVNLTGRPSVAATPRRPAPPPAGP